MTASGERDVEYMRQAIAISRRALQHGNRPYGAVLVAADGRVLAEGQNTERSDRDLTGHAETNLLRDAYRTHDPATLAGATLYASGEPCPMCAGTIFYSGIRRVVYGVSRERVRELSPQSRNSPRLGVSSRDILGTATRPIEIVGPLLEDEAGHVFAEVP
ncbi:MAG: nucleoside deaminase [Chloroflexota bacterium]|nr:nucleoside deaminase [Chloroflexota bacterium]